MGVGEEEVGGSNKHIRCLFSIYVNDNSYSY